MSRPSKVTAALRWGIPFALFAAFGQLVTESRAIGLGLAGCAVVAAFGTFHVSKLVNRKFFLPLLAVCAATSVWAGLAHSYDVGFAALMLAGGVTHGLVLSSRVRLQELALGCFALGGMIGAMNTSGVTRIGLAVSAIVAATVVVRRRDQP